MERASSAGARARAAFRHLVLSAHVRRSWGLSRREEAAARRGRLSLLSIALLLALAWWPASALARGGSIAGTVQEAATPHDPIQGIEVCAASLDPSAEEESAEGEFGCATTDAAGDYTIASLNAGSYEVEFVLPLVTSLNFIAKFYDEEPLTAEPTPVAVAEGSTTTGIDAQLEPGGELSGTVTAAGVGPLEGADVCARLLAGESKWTVACARSGAGGVFTVAGLPAGMFLLAALYVAKEELGIGYFGGAKVGEATPIALSAREVKTGFGIELTLQHYAPEGGLAGGGGAPEGPGATGPAGPAGSQHVSPSGLLLTSRRIAVGKGGGARVGVECAGAVSCTGRLELRESDTLRQGGRSVRSTVVLGAVHYRLAAGRSATVTMRLDDVGLRRLRARGGRLPFRMKIVQAAPTSQAVSVEEVVLVSTGGRKGR